MATKKPICKWIREEVKKLPSKTYQAAMRFEKPIVEKGEDGKLRVVAGEIGEFPVSHYHRAKRMYKKHGIEGLNLYFGKHGFKLIKI